MNRSARTQKHNWASIIRCGLATATVGLASALSAGVAAQAADAASSTALNLVPWPQTVQTAAGAMKIGPQSRIVFADPALAPLAKVLADEIVQVTGRQLAAAPGQPAAGDIGLQIDPALKGEAYTLQVADSALVKGGNYNAAALGSVTLLQALSGQGDDLSLPHISVIDRPKADYRGLMLDVARQWNAPVVLEQCVELCRLYKIRYLHVHFSDSGAYTFPSTAYPKLNECMHYTMEQMQRLARMADERGVIIVPEMEGPGHSNMMQHAYPMLWGGVDNVMHMPREKIYPATDTVIGEMCDVFKSSPYFHIGADEAWYQGIGWSGELGDYLKNHKLRDSYDVYLLYIARLNEMVKKRGKRTIVWEGFHGDGSGQVKVPKDVIVMEFEVAYNMPNDLVRMGYDVINASWTPLYVLGPQGGRDAEEIYRWDMYQFKKYGAAWFDPGVRIYPTQRVLGVQMCSWEQPGNVQVVSLRPRLPAMSERIWNPEAGKDYADFARRLRAIDSRLVPRLVILPAWVEVQGLAIPGENRFRTALSIAVDPAVSGAAARYTTDDKDPTPESTLYSGPIRIEDSRTVKIRLFDAAGKQVGFEWREAFELDPIEVTARGLTVEKDPKSPPNVFRQEATLAMASGKAGQIRYTLDGLDPNKDSKLYAAPIRLETTTVVKARLFDEKGVPRPGRPFACTYEIQPLEFAVKGLAAEKDPQAPSGLFLDALSITMVPHLPGQIRYTTDGKEPTKDSTLYTSPLRLEDSTTIRARLFDAKGAPRGRELSAAYECRPLEMATEVNNDPPCPPVMWAPDTEMRVFSKFMKVTLRSLRSDGQVRYSLDGNVSANSPVYTGPITVTRPAYFAAQFFDRSGKPHGKAVNGCFYSYEKSLTTGKPATASSHQGECSPEWVVDGCTYHERPWMASGLPCWLQVDLEKVYKLNKVKVTTYWSREYHYTIEVSTDGKAWTKVVDYPNPKKELSKPEGEVYEFAPTPGRYLRINNCGLMVELGAWAADGETPAAEGKAKP